MLQLAARAGLPAFCEKPVALDLAALDAAIDEVERAGILVQIGFQRRFDAGYRAARRGGRRAARSAAAGRCAQPRTTRRRPPRPTSRPRAASSATSTSTISTPSASSRARRSSRSTQTAPCARRPWFADHGDVDVAAAVLKLSGGALAILSGTRHDPLGYDVRLEALRHAGQRCRRRRRAQPDPLARGGRDAAGLPAYADFMQRFHQAYQDELAAFVATVLRRRSQRLHACTRRAPRCSSRSPQTARESNGDPSQSTRSPAHRSPRADIQPDQTRHGGNRWVCRSKRQRRR